MPPKKAPAKAADDDLPDSSEDEDGEKYFELKTKAINPPDNADKEEEEDL